MHTYSQYRGVIQKDGVTVGHGYSGHGKGLDNPDMEAVEGIGPIPRGQWKITNWEDYHPRLGPIVAILVPVGHDAHGRSLFRIHGDNSAENHSASDGCIVTDRANRIAWRTSGDMDLTVVA